MRAMCASAQSKPCLEFRPKSTATRRSLPRAAAPLPGLPLELRRRVWGHGDKARKHHATTSLQLYSSTVSIDRSSAPRQWFRGDAFPSRGLRWLWFLQGRRCGVPYRGIQWSKQEDQLGKEMRLVSLKEFSIRTSYCLMASVSLSAGHQPPQPDRIRDCVCVYRWYDLLLEGQRLCSASAYRLRYINLFHVVRLLDSCQYFVVFR
ncbi:uncharacterized protein LOC120656231 [Panicum virgatum]|uniref:Uncharacterized protein n=1 Tax=Panicum virgatum TaxID=38727 RepID=A0A8T0X8S9_PANVG|nr:uncharacterized protein LOC120656231 [Panicum virgatum]KAG2651899.1 hypothetical protein PVAP13_1NG312438 [Panicum virgatum]